jgi:hypothetical protein
MAGAPAAGLEELPLLFPIAQYMGAHPGEVTHFTDGVEGLARGVFFHAG